MTDTRKEVCIAREKREGTTVWIGDYDNYVIPAAVLQKAEELSPGRTGDRRTRGYRFISAWALEQEAR